MSRRIDYSARFSHPPKRVYEALADRDHWEARTREMRKYSDNHVEEFAVSADGIHVVLHHVIPRSSLPEPARAVMKKDMVITRTETYGPFDERSEGRYEASVPAGPGSLTGTMTLFGHEDGATLLISSEAKVHLPLIGGKLEDLILTNLVDVFAVEAAITTDWLGRQ
ncbi:DUF2505 domain-containing protein [Rhodococcus coprophilus]|uniref:Protein of uncharacterized function (DUF2505) n=1 Tax=Rhodococcus coprophilus TaxID=38310 RepID=A0A2X4UBS3_9NOCA|nr:DUF2505 domain-containing protein [Rhodococcus coprophilus]MBM7459745.1 hypothetical protein [Rhodococcus coprophilus]SQI37257.1 Protein of uncharacterised function (DUF2505) [Rhodococcus coprophilus]